IRVPEDISVALSAGLRGGPLGGLPGPVRGKGRSGTPRPQGADETTAPHPGLKNTRLPGGAPSAPPREQVPPGNGPLEGLPALRGRLAPHVPYRLGHFVAVPCAARRPAVPNGASQWGSRWVVPHLRRPPRIPAASWLWVDASRIRPGLLARGRRGMGSVGGWPLAKPTTQHLGVAAREGAPPGDSPRTGPPPAGGPGHARPRPSWPPSVRGARSPLGNLDQ